MTTGANSKQHGLNNIKSLQPTKKRRCKENKAKARVRQQSRQESIREALAA